MSAPSPSRRERDLAEWAWGPGVRAERHAEQLAQYREELLRPFEEMMEDYRAFGDARVSDDLARLLCMLRGTP